MSIRSRIRGALSRAKKRAKDSAAKRKAKSAKSRAKAKAFVSKVSKASAKRQASRAKTTRAKRQKTKQAVSRYISGVKQRTRASEEKRIQRDIKAGLTQKQARRRQDIRREVAKGVATGASFAVPAGLAVRGIAGTARGAKVVKRLSGRQVRTLATAGYVGAEGFGVYAAEDKTKQAAGAAGRALGAGAGLFATGRRAVGRTSKALKTDFKPVKTKRKTIRQDPLGPRTEYKTEGLKVIREDYVFGGKQVTRRGTVEYDPVALLGSGQRRPVSVKLEKAGRKKGSMETTYFYEEPSLDLPLLPRKGYRGVGKKTRPDVRGGGIDLTRGEPLMGPTLPKPKPSPSKKPSKQIKKNVLSKKPPEAEAGKYETIRRRDPRTGKIGTFYKPKTITQQKTLIKSKTKLKTKPKTKAKTRTKTQTQEELFAPQKLKTKPKQLKRTQAVLLSPVKLEKAIPKVKLTKGAPTLSKAGLVTDFYTPTRTRSITRTIPPASPLLLGGFKFGGGGRSDRPARILGEKQAGRFTRSFTAQVLGLKAPKKRKYKSRYTGFELRV